MKFSDLANQPGAEFVDPEEAEEAKKPAGPSALESGARGLAQGATLGFSDELAGGGEALLDKLRGAHEALGELYLKHRNESRAANKAAEEANPTIYGGAKIAGGLAPALATAGESLPLQLAAGAGLGAANAVGDADKLDDKAIQEAAIGALGGAAGAGVGAGLARGAGSLVAKAGPALEAGAEKLGDVAGEAVKGLGHAGVVGSLLHGNIPGAALGVAAPLLAPVAKRAATSLGKTLGRVGMAAAKNPTLLGRYGAVLANAAQAGPAALNATHFSLAQTDPAYQRHILDIQNEHPELDEDEEGS